MTMPATLTIATRIATLIDNITGVSRNIYHQHVAICYQQSHCCECMSICLLVAAAANTRTIAK
jgi:hypothetical protein